MRIVTNKNHKLNDEYVVILKGENQKPELPQELNGIVEKLIESDKSGEILISVGAEIKRIYIQELDSDKEKVRKVGGKISKHLLNLDHENDVEDEKSSEKFLIKGVIYGAELLGENLYAFIEGLNLGSYIFDKYINNKKTNEIEEIVISGIDEDIEEAILVSDYQKFARDLVNEPSNVIYPETLAKQAKDECEKNGVEMDIYDEVEIENFQMEAFLSVARGSSNEPRLIVMRYMGNPQSDEILGLVGKGITYDTGGYSIKPTPSMLSMKSDMGGAASVIAAINAIAKLNLKSNVVGVCALCENSVSGSSYKPGDIIGSMKGTTIEVLNTDAEGRLTLADAVHFALSQEGATKIVDIATLTGAALVISSHVATPVVSNDDEFYKKLEKATQKTDEKMFRLPVYDEFRDFIKGKEADIKNTTSEGAGCITAGLFVGEFVDDKPWLHLDIAGTSMSKNAKNYVSYGATGAPVRTLIELAKDF